LSQAFSLAFFYGQAFALMLQALSLPCIMLFPNGLIRRINAFHIYNSLKGCNIKETGTACLFPKKLQNDRISLKEFFICRRPSAWHFSTGRLLL